MPERTVRALHFRKCTFSTDYSVTSDPAERGRKSFEGVQGRAIRRRSGDTQTSRQNCKFKVGRGAVLSEIRRFSGGILTESITSPAKYVTANRETAVFPGASGPFPEYDVIRSFGTTNPTLYSIVFLFLINCFGLKISSRDSGLPY